MLPIQVGPTAALSRFAGDSCTLWHPWWPLSWPPTPSACLTTNCCCLTGSPHFDTLDDPSRGHQHLLHAWPQIVVVSRVLHCLRRTKFFFWLWSSLLVVASPLLLLLVPCYQLYWWSLLSTTTDVSAYLFPLLHICVSTDFFLTCCDVGCYKYFNLSYYSISAIWWHCYCFLCYFIRSFWCPCCSDITSMTECVSSGSFRQVILQLIHPLSVWILILPLLTSLGY